MKALPKLLVLLLAAFIFHACQDHMTDSQCPEGKVLCGDGQCHGCCTVGDCDTGQLCCNDFTCRACCMDGDCDDGLYCNGPETCTDSGCVAGTPVGCDDGIDCTTDACDDAAGRCIYAPDDNLCPQGNICDPYRGGCVPDLCFSDYQCDPGAHCCPDGRCQECCTDRDCAWDKRCNQDYLCELDPTLECHQDTDCSNGEYCCYDGQCHTCCRDDHCLGLVPDCVDDYIICNDDYECECVCYQEGEYCDLDLEGCCVGLSCDLFTSSCMPTCTADADCHARTDVPHSGDLKCKNGVCDFDHCSTDADCPPGRFCHHGDCVSASGCSEIVSCRVEPGSAPIRQGTTVQLTASAILQDGLIAPGVTFGWTSDDTGIAAVDQSGTVTGGPQPGTAAITVTVTGCTTSCQATITNHTAVQTGRTRVLVVDELAGTPIQGATVVVGAQAPLTTDADGTAEFPIELSPASPADITVSRSDYHYVTFKAVESSNVIVHLGKVYQLDQNDVEITGGIRGMLRFDQIHCEPGHTCDVKLGLAGLCFPGSPVHINPRRIVGDAVVTPIDFGGVTGEAYFPEGFVLGLNYTWFREYYTPTGVPGTRVAWALGGEIDLAEMIDMLGSLLVSGDELDIIQAILILLGESATHTALSRHVNITPGPKDLDTTDLNGNGETDDYVPDYWDFTSLNMTLKVPVDHTMTFIPPTLPVGVYDTVVVVAGAIVPGDGLVPLGISAGVDSKEDFDWPDGIIEDPIVLHTSELAGRFPEAGTRRVTLALAFNLASLSVANPVRLRLGGQVLFHNNFEGTHTLAPFMEQADAFYDPATRHLDINQLPTDADTLQAIFSTDSGRGWHVLTENTASFDLPNAPPEGDRSSRAELISIDLVPGVTYQDLPDFNETNLGDMAELVQAFSFTEVP